MFFNFGYLPKQNSEEEEKFKNMAEKINDEYFKPVVNHFPNICLYEKVLSMCPTYPKFENFSILEVGCGLGNGMRLMQR